MNLLYLISLLSPFQKTLTVILISNLNGIIALLH